jgi:hypothetical protein
VLPQEERPRCFGVSAGPRYSKPAFQPLSTSRLSVVAFFPSGLMHSILLPCPRFAKTPSAPQMYFR